MPYRFYMGKDETQNRLNLQNHNADAQVHHWKYQDSQTFRVAKRSGGQALVKKLQLELQKERTAYFAHHDAIKSALGTHYPKFADKLISNWSNADFDDFKVRCQQALQDAYPSLHITDSQVNQLLANLLTHAMQCQRVNSVFVSIENWLKQNVDWLFKHAAAIKLALQNADDDNSTDTSSVSPNPNLTKYDYLRDYARQLAKHSIYTRQQNLQRYRIRMVIEKALVASNTTKTHKTEKQKEEDEGLEM